jgi:hypothetical protein
MGRVMANKNWKDRLTQADWANWQAAHQRFLDLEAELWATNPNNPNIATGIYPPGMRQFIPDHERGCVSKLGGVAQSATATTKGQGR